MGCAGHYCGGIGYCMECSLKADQTKLEQLGAFIYSVPCEFCEGTGKLMRWYTDRDGSEGATFADSRCAACCGTGAMIANNYSDEDEA